MKDGAEISNAAYDQLRSCELVSRETVTPKFYFVQGFKAGIEAARKAHHITEDLKKLHDFVDNGFYFAGAAK